ncbi:MAG: alkaline phosphatase family protein [Hyphomicrobiales bacterium]|nr:alkaline phosphatase family protein [Hyphomicrobiales bacterium]MCP5374274.1 alkaline phosphatase family protein [Hyphomicrobiales bacterium]
MAARNKVILVLVDGLRYDTAVHEMGFLEGAVAHGQARRRAMRCALPSLSRTLYHTIHTGLPPQVHGITSNDMVCAGRHDSIFSVARAQGRRTAAAAYCWFAELYNRIPYDPVLDREVDDDGRAIQHGRFYMADDFPDPEMFRTADMLVGRFAPDYLLVHPMGCDFVGHLYGGESKQYRHQAAKADNLLAQAVPGWLDRGYHVLVTSDHGMDAHGRHGGTREEVRRVPFYHLGGEVNGAEEEGEADQLSVAPTVLRLMGLPIPAAMAAAPLT